MHDEKEMQEQQEYIKKWIENKEIKKNKRKNKIKKIKKYLFKNKY